MSGLRADLQAYRLAFRRPFVTAFGTLHHRSGWILRIQDAEGNSGFGEAAPLPGFGGGDPAQVERDLQHLLAFAQTLSEAPPTPHFLDQLLRTPEFTTLAPSALAALDLALADLAARRAGLPLARWLRPQSTSTSVPVNATIGGQSPADTADAAQRALAAGYRSIKLKLCGDDDLDLLRIAAVHAILAGETAPARESQPDRAKEGKEGRWDRARSTAQEEPRSPRGLLRLDANASWPLPRALRLLGRLAPYALSSPLGGRIEYIEQPTPITGDPEADVAALLAITTASPIPIAADEILLDPRAAEMVLEQRAAALLILKPALLGGPSATMDLAQHARAAGLSSIVTTALDAAVGRQGALHLAAALGLTRPCGLATGGLLAQDLAPTLKPDRGHLSLPTAPGLGIAPSRKP